MASLQTDPIINFNITGRKKITDVDFQDNFILAGKEEHTMIITSTDSYVPVSFSKIGSATRMYFIITPKTTVTSPPEVTLKFTVDNTVDPVYDIEIPCLRFFVWNPTSTFAGFITDIEVKTASTASVEVQVRIYGE